MPKKRILLVDDEPELVEMLKIRLEANSYEVATALSGVEGLEAVARQKPDLILLDVGMPVMNGFEVLERLKADERTWGIPVVMLTAKGDAGSISQSQEMRATDYFTKPFEPAELLEFIGRYLGR
ncbi:MAG: response regulator [Candidatus Omnitrophica bacterium]|nr:response regulator [Candidatus Omnitrophota bacterium]